MKRLLGTLVLMTIALGGIALLVPTPQAHAANCIFCPQIAIECGPCYQLVPQTCTRCAYCKRIPGCHQ